MMSIMLGMKIDRYEILSLIGAGGMGEVYRARDTRLDRDVAIKVLPGSVSSDAGRLDRFVREAKVLASLNHPNIGAIYGFEETPSAERYLVLELIEGEPLSERLKRGPLPLRDALCVGRGIAEALEAAHSRNVVHRDLKPANVMLTAVGGVKVLDFGLAQVNARLENQDLRNFKTDPADSSLNDSTVSFIRGGMSGAIEGTPGYMSPEQVRGDRQDHRTDLFAFGCLLFECITGTAAFSGTSAMERVTAILSVEPRWFLLEKSIPQTVRDLLEQCLEKDVDRRTPDIRIVRRQLDQSLGETEHVQSAIPNNLPSETSSFIGRGADVTECMRLLDHSRILTLTGVGGIGKTRLALQLAKNLLGRFHDGVWFVDLAPLSDPTLVVQIVATVLGVKEQAGTPLIETLKRRVASGHMLIVLDNCEHLLSACAEVVETLLAAGANLKIIVTSREGLSITGEQSMVVRPLTYPAATSSPDLREIESFEAVRLFVNRAKLIRHELALDLSNAQVIAEICRRLDGIPLAIELAAALVRVLSPAQIQSRLDHRFMLLTGGSKTALPRHQTLRAAIQWSYDHLRPEEQSSLKFLSVFAGGWTLSSAMHIMWENGTEFEALDMITRLLDKSLVVRDRDGLAGCRYRMLETVRQYAQEKLIESEENQTASSRHLGFFVAFTEHAALHLTGAEQAEWLIRLEDEHENLRAALSWARTQESAAETGLRLAVGAALFWQMRGHWSEGRRWLNQMMERDGLEEKTKGRALHFIGILADRQGDEDDALAASNKALSIRQEIEDKQGIADSLLHLGMLATRAEDFKLARSRIEQGLAIMRDLGNTRGIGISLGHLGIVAYYLGDYSSAQDRYNEALEIMRKVGDKSATAMALSNLGAVAVITRNYRLAKTHFEEALVISQEIGEKRVSAAANNNLGAVAIEMGNYSEAVEYLKKALQVYCDIGMKHGIAGSLELFARASQLRGGAEMAAKLFGAAESLRDAIHYPMPPSERADYDRSVASVRSALGGDRFEKEWIEGRNTSVEKAIELAMGARKSPD